MATRILLLTLSAALCAAPSPVTAGPHQPWSTSELTAFADVIVSGRVVSVQSAMTAERTIYTYITLDVADVLKGEVGSPQITIKQLGGVVDGYGLSIAEQATFEPGEDVLLFLEARPRDGSLHTSALWQGKWQVVAGGRGERMAMRDAPRGHADSRVLSFDELRQTVARVAGEPSERVTFTTRPADTPVPGPRRGFRLFDGQEFRYLHSPVVTVQTGGQPGLAGGGFAEISASIAAWNNAGSSFRFVPGGSNAVRCGFEQLGNGTVTITFMDPCNEIPNSGSTAAIAGSFFIPGQGGTRNGITFARATEGFLINNDGATALSLLTIPGCFQEVESHELGHVLGLEHSADPDALMFPSIPQSACQGGSRGVRADDVQGLLFIYGSATGTPAPPPSGGTPTSAPTNVIVTIQGSTLSGAWTAVPNAASYRADFRVGHQDGGAVAASVTVPSNAITVGIPSGVTGAFNLVVTPLGMSGAAGPPSARADFLIGGGQAPGACTAAPVAPQGLTAGIAGGVAQVQWTPSAGATGYAIQAGSAVGGSDLFPRTSIGASTGASSPVPAGFRAWVRVSASNACGTSSADVFLQ